MKFPKIKTLFVQSRKTPECIYALIYRHSESGREFVTVSASDSLKCSVHLFT